MSGPPSDEAALHSDDPAAFARLYDRHVHAVYRQAFRRLRVAQDAEETTQDVFLLAWERRRRIRLVDGSALPWLLVTARNLAANRQRRSRAVTPGSEALERMPSARAVEDEVTDRMLADAIDEAVDALSERDRILYSLCIDEGVAYRDAAAMLGTTHGAVRNRLTRIRKLLRAALARYDLQEGGLS